MAVALLAAPSSASLLGAQAPVARPVVIDGGTVIDVRSGAHLAGARVVIEGGRIRSVGARGAIPRGARVIDARGRYVIPGLWDMHVEQALPLTEHLPPDSNAAFFHPLLLAHGVTGVRDVAGPLHVLAQWSREIVAGTRVGPRQIFTGPKLGMTPVADGAPFPIRTERDLGTSLDLLRRGGAGSVYLFDVDDALRAALASGATARGLRVEGNVPPGWTLRTAVAGGIRLIDHLDGVLLGGNPDEARVRRELQTLEERPWWARVAWRLRLLTPPAWPPALALDGFSEARAESLFTELAARGVYQVPTLRLLSTLNRSADSAVMLPPSPLYLRPPRQPWRGYANEPYPPAHPLSRVLARQRWSVAAMQRAGVGILAGSDTPNLYAAPGRSLHDELELLVGAGLTPLQALQGATSHVADYLGAADSLGAVAPGHVADVVVLAGDPTADIRNVRRVVMVVARGRMYDRAALDTLVAGGTRMAAEVERYWVARRAGTNSGVQ